MLFHLTFKVILESSKADLSFVKSAFFVIVFSAGRKIFSYISSIWKVIDKTK